MLDYPAQTTTRFLTERLLLTRKRPLLMYLDKSGCRKISMTVCLSEESCSSKQRLKAKIL